MILKLNNQSEREHSQCISLPICAVASTDLVQECSRDHFLLGFRLNNIIFPICFLHYIVIDYNVPKLVQTVQTFLLIDVAKVKQTTLSCSHSGFLKHLRSLCFLHSSDMELCSSVSQWLISDPSVLLACHHSHTLTSLSTLDLNGVVMWLSLFLARV